MTVFDHNQQLNLLDEEEFIAIRESLRELPPKYRVTIAMALSGFNQSEIGFVLGLTRAAIGALKTRALKSLKKIHMQE